MVERASSSTLAERREESAKPARARCRVFIRNSLGRRCCRLWPDRTGDRPPPMVDDIIWGTSSQRGAQSGDLGPDVGARCGFTMFAPAPSPSIVSAALGITSVNMAAASIMSGAEDLVIAGGTEMMSMEGPSRRRAVHDGRRQSPPARKTTRNRIKGVCADAVRDARGHYPAGRLTGWDLRAKQKAANAHQAWPFRQESGFRFTARTAVLALRPGGISAAADQRSKGLAGPEASVHGRWRIMRLMTRERTYRNLILQKYPDLDINFMHHAGNSSGVVERLGGDTAGVAPIMPRRMA